MTAPRTLVTAGIVLIAITGLIHAVEAPDQFEEKTYVGVLFVLNVAGAVVVATGIWRGARGAWWLGVVVAGGAFVAFILSRTTGLPGFKDDEWEGLGVVALIVEACFCLVASRVLANAPTARAQPSRGRAVGA
jgi:hypothetical protein